MPRTHSETHPWISFELDLRQAPHQLWLLLGEARSKCDHLAGVPLKPSVAKKLNEVYLAKGVHATAAIEGNTLKETDVLAKMDGTLRVGKSKEYLAKEIENILSAANAVVSRLETQDAGPVTPQEICEYNRLILSGLALEDHVVPGEYRKISVGVANYRAPAAEFCENLMQRMCDWLNNADFRESKDPIVFGLLRAILAHIYLAWIHPFGDGNGRTARLVEVHMLLEAGVPMPAAHLLSNHYNQTRSEYYRKLAEASKKQSPIDFITYAVQGFVDQIRDQLAIVREQQWRVAWQNFVHETFGSTRTPADNRCVRVLLDLSSVEQSIERSKLKELTPALALLYADKTDKTLSRDLNRLSEMGLVEINGKRVRARREEILAFLPRGKKGAREAHLARVMPGIAKVEGQLDLFSLLDEANKLGSEE